MGAETYVRPLSAYPLALLLIVLFFNFFAIITPHMDWRVHAAISVCPCHFGGDLIGVLFAPLVLRGQAYWGHALHAWATLIIGLAFFISAVWMNRVDEELRFTVKWMLAGFVLDILWSGLQGATFYLHMLPKPLVTHWQLVF